MRNFFLRNKKIKNVLFVALGLVVVFFISLSSFALAYNDKTYPNVYLADKNLGGFSKNDLGQFLKAEIEKTNSGFEIRFDEKGWTITPNDIDLNYNLEKSTENIYAIGRRPSFFKSIIEQTKALFNRANSALVFDYNQEKLENFLAKVKEEIEVPETDAGLIYKKNEWVLNPEKEGKRIEREKLKKDIDKNFSNLRNEPVLIVTYVSEPKIKSEQVLGLKGQLEQKTANSIVLKFSSQKFELEKEKLASWVEFYEEGKSVNFRLKDEKIKAYVAALSKEINQEPKDARLKMESDKVTVFQDSQDGYTLNQEKTAEDIKNAFTNEIAEINLAVETISPAVSMDKINSVGLKEIIGRGKTSFKGSPPNRIHNIKNGVSILNGSLIKPGEEFSVVQTLGQVDDTTGFLPELVIKENRTTPEFGGGLCQVSTTLFRAMLNAGLKITERQNHSYRVSYYEPPVGLDATVYLPKPDLKFLNDTPGYILVQGYVEGNNLIFELYGAKDGRTSKIDGPYASDFVDPPPPIYAETDTLSAGEKKQIEKPHQGATAVAYYTVWDKDGKEMFKQTFKSKYKAWPARFLVGTGTPVPVPEPTPSEKPVPAASETSSPTLTPSPSETSTPSSSPTSS